MTDVTWYKVAITLVVGTWALRECFLRGLVRLFGAPPEVERDLFSAVFNIGAGIGFTSVLVHMWKGWQ